MVVKISREDISSRQQDLLDSIRTSRILPTQRILDVLSEVVTDDDINDGSESLHPDWLEIYERYKRAISGLSSQAAEDVRSFFESLSLFDDGLDLIDPSKLKISFLLGAGASKPEPSGIPTVQELLPDMLMRARRLEREEVTKLVSFCNDENINNIEDLLTAVQLSAFCSRNPNMLRLVDFLLFRTDESEIPRFYRTRRRMPVDVSSVAFMQDTLQVLFGLLSSRMLPADPNAGHVAIAEFVKSHPSVTIVTTNYDCCMDLALTRGNIPFSYSVDFANIHEVKKGNEFSTPLIKLHGSLNWFYCETCQQIHLLDIETTVAQYKDDKSFYPVIAVCKECGGQRRGLLIPPLAMKFDIAPPLNSLLDRAAEAFNGSELIIVVGFSFADADLYISRMISKAMQISEPTKLLIFDPDRTVAQKVRRKFLTRIPNFDSSRILAVRGDCAITLPAFLSGTLKDLKKKPIELRHTIRKFHVITKADNA